METIEEIIIACGPLLIVVLSMSGLVASTRPGEKVRKTIHEYEKKD